MNENISKTVRRLLLVVAGGFLMACNIVAFARPANLFPGGFTGISLLIQDVFSKYFNLKIPYFLVNYALNAAPIIIGIMYIGKKFTFFSIVMIFISGIF